MKKVDKAYNMENKFLEEKIINKLKSGNIKMKPKVYFILKALFFLFFGGLAVLLGLFLISFIFFILRINNLIYLFGFGFLGMSVFLKTLPWFLVFLSLILIIFFETLAKKHRAVWRKPVFYSLLIFIIIFLSFGFAISKTDLHSRILRVARQDRLPILGGFYREYSNPRDRDVHSGVVLETKEKSFLLLTSEQEELEVFVKDENYFLKKQEFKKGDSVIVLGERRNGIINLFRIKKFNRNINYHLRRANDK